MSVAFPKRVFEGVSARPAVRFCTDQPVRKGLRALKNSFATMTAIGALMLAPRPGLAGPTGGSVVAGSAGIQQSGNTTNINQSSNSAVINWQGFSIGKQETVNFNQPSASSTTLNRVIGNETSVINGALNANGQVFIVNSAGVLFGKGARSMSAASSLDARYLQLRTSRLYVIRPVLSARCQQCRAGDAGILAFHGRKI